MTKNNLNRLFAGIGLTACCAGLALLGFVFGNSAAHGLAMSGHELFVPGLFCLAMGVLSVISTQPGRSGPPQK